MRPRIGFLTDALDQNCQTSVFEGVERACAAADADLIVFSGPIMFDAASRAAQYASVRAFVGPSTLDALVVHAGAILEHYPAESLRSFLSSLSPMPMATVGSEFPGVPAAMVDDGAGIAEAVRHLAEDHGYRRIGFIRGPDGHGEAEARFRAYRSALEAAGLDYDPALVSAPALFSKEAGSRALRGLLDAVGEPPRAIVCADDFLADGALVAAAERGLRVPEDLAVVGFDDLEASEFLSPPLATVAQPFVELGASAAEAVLRRLRGGSPEDRIVLSPLLRPRPSCGCDSPEVPHRAMDRGGSTRTAQYYRHWRETKRRRLKDELDRYFLHVASHRLLVSRNREELRATAREVLPPLGAEETQVVLYGEEGPIELGATPPRLPSSSSQFLALGEGRRIAAEDDEETFPTFSIAPNLFDPASPVRDVVLFLPLCLGTETYGHVLFHRFSSSFIAVAEPLRLYLTTALRSCDLLRRLEDEVKAKSMMLLNLGHELKTPISIASGYLDRYLEGRGDERSVLMARQGLSKMEGDVRNFLFAERLEWESGAPLPLVDLSSALEAKADAFRALADSRGIRVECSAAPRLAARIEHPALDRVLNNLLENAVRYNEEGGLVLVRAEESGGRAVVVVSNTGSRIPWEDREAVFRPFLQLSGPKRNCQGLGLGLGIARKIAEAAGGSLRLLPTADLTEFEFALPAARPAPHERAEFDVGPVDVPVVPEFPPTVRRPGFPAVLAVDDNPHMLGFLVDCLSGFCDVYRAGDGLEALDALRDMPVPSLVISDVMMDGLDGFSLLQVIKDEGLLPGVPFLFLTARDSDADRLRGLESGAWDYICKPFKEADLVLKVRNVLETGRDYREGVRERLREELGAALSRAFAAFSPARLGRRPEAAPDPEAEAEAEADIQGISRREMEIAALLEEGYLYKEVADRLGLSVNTVKTHISRMYRKMSVGNRTEFLNNIRKGKP